MPSACYTFHLLADLFVFLENKKGTSKTLILPYSCIIFCFHSMNAMLTWNLKYNVTLYIFKVILSVSARHIVNNK